MKQSYPVLEIGEDALTDAPFQSIEVMEDQTSISYSEHCFSDDTKIYTYTEKMKEKIIEEAKTMNVRSLADIDEDLQNFKKQLNGLSMVNNNLTLPTNSQITIGSTTLYNGTQVVVPVTQLDSSVTVNSIALMDKRKEKINPNLYDAGSGGGLPEGLQYSKSGGLEIKDLANHTLTINPNNISLSENLDMFESSTHKIDTSLYSGGGGGSLPDGLTYSKATGLKIASDGEGSLTINTKNLTSVISLVEESGKINSDLYEKGITTSSEMKGDFWNSDLSVPDNSKVIVGSGNTRLEIKNIGIDFIPHGMLSNWLRQSEAYLEANNFKFYFPGIGGVSLFVDGKINPALYDSGGGGLPEGLTYKDGIFKIAPNSTTSNVGLEVENLLKINSKEDGTKGNLCLETPDADYLIKEPTIYIDVNDAGLDEAYNVQYQLNESDSTCEVVTANDKSISNYSTFSKDSVVRRISDGKIFTIISIGIIQPSSLGDNGFNRCDNLKLQSIPKTIKAIYEMGLAYTKSTIHDDCLQNLETLYEDGFDSCIVDIHKFPPKLKNYHESAFRGCSFNNNTIDATFISDASIFGDKNSSTIFFAASYGTLQVNTTVFNELLAKNIIKQNDDYYIFVYNDMFLETGVRIEAVDVIA